MEVKLSIASDSERVKYRIKEVLEVIVSHLTKPRHLYLAPQNWKLIVNDSFLILFSVHMNFFDSENLKKKSAVNLNIMGASYF